MLIVWTFQNHLPPRAVARDEPGLRLVEPWFVETHHRAHHDDIRREHDAVQTMRREPMPNCVASCSVVCGCYCYRTHVSCFRNTRDCCVTLRLLRGRAWIMAVPSYSMLRNRHWTYGHTTRQPCRPSLERGTCAAELLELFTHLHLHQRILERDGALVHQSRQILVERVHAFLLAGL